MTMEVGRTADGDLSFTDIPGALTYSLMELPSLLADDAPGLKDRFARSPYGSDDDRSEEWRRNAAPELWRLFANAREIVIEDLRTLRPSPGEVEGHDLTIPAESHAAWLSALAAARVTLGELHEVGPDDLSGPLPVPVRSERDRGIILIQMLGWLQAILIEDGASDA